MLALFLLLCSARTKYGVMVDAGSSGTRAFIYQWETNDIWKDVKPAPNTENAWKLFLNEKLSDGVEAVDEIIDKVVKFAAKRIDPAFYETTRIFVYATGGMRLLKEEVREEILQRAIKRTRQVSPFKVKDRYIRVISGTEEAAFGFLSINHLLGNLKNNNLTVGSMDLGGASFQISHEAKRYHGLKDVITVKIGQKEMHIYAHSYLSYGVISILDTITQHLHLSQKKDAVYNPCIQRGYAGKISEFNTVGTGSFEQCSDLLRAVVLGSDGFKRVLTVGLDDQREFYGMASFSYVFDFLNLSDSSSEEDFKQASSRLCSANWNDIAKEHEENAFIHTYCLSSVYQHLLVSEKFKLPQRSIKLRRTNQINGVSLSWALGAMLSEVAEIEFEDAQ